MGFFFVSFVVFFVILVNYFFLARKLNITDRPNQRSSHSGSTVTGAGFIFPLAFTAALFLTNTFVNLRATVAGLFLLTCISYLDDLKAVKKIPRIIVQVISVWLILWQTGGLFHMTIWTIILAFIFVVGIINAYNFMDGINGVTALYSLVTIGTLFYLSKHGYSRLPKEEVFICMIAALVAFSFFNIRGKALLFCGDVGSITLAYIISFLIMYMMIQDDSGKWILLIGVYGLDSVATISLRIFRGENIGEAHRTHFYQYLTTGRKISHMLVSVLYAVVQLLLNWSLISLSTFSAVGIYIVIVSVYIFFRVKLEGKKRLFFKYY